MTDFSRAIVRPAVTFGIVGAMVFISVTWAIETGEYEEVFTRMAAFGGPIVGFWFGERKAQNGGAQYTPVAPANTDDAPDHT